MNPKGTTDEKIDALEILAYCLKALNKEDPVKETFYKSVNDTALLKSDYIRMKNGTKPKYDEANSIIKREVRNNDLTRLQKFKRWPKDNLVRLSVIAISVPGIITTTIIGARKAVVKGAQATGKLAKAVYNIGKKLGPLRAPLLTVLAQAIS